MPLARHQLVIVPVLGLALSGCASGDYLDSYSWRSAKNGVPSEVLIRIDQRADAGTVCSNTYHANLVACADNQIAGGLCIITVPPHAAPTLLAHEALHCFGIHHE